MGLSSLLALRSDPSIEFNYLYKYYTGITLALGGRKYNICSHWAGGGGGRMATSIKKKKLNKVGAELRYRSPRPGLTMTGLEMVSRKAANQRGNGWSTLVLYVCMYVSVCPKLSNVIYLLRA